MTEAERLATTKRSVCPTAWKFSTELGSYTAPEGWVLRKQGTEWVATHNGSEVLRGRFLFNVMMELCG